MMVMTARPAYGFALFFASSVGSCVALGCAPVEDPAPSALVESVESVERAGVDDVGGDRSDGTRTSSLRASSTSPR